MAEGYLGISTTIWIFEVLDFLSGSDILALRLVHKLSYQFFTKLTAPMASSIDSKIEELKRSLGTGVREHLEKLSEYINSRKSFIRSTQIPKLYYSELRYTRSPPIMMYQALELVTCLALNKTSLTWHQIQAEMSQVDSLQNIIEKFTAGEVSPVPIHFRELAKSLNVDEVVRRSNDGCGALLTIAQVYIELQDLYASPEGVELMGMKTRVKHMMECQRVCRKVSAAK